MISRPLPLLAGLLLLLSVIVVATSSGKETSDPVACFAQENLVAWCIVPFDAQKRTPEQRAQMLRELGLRHCAYDWRAEHVPTFEEEIRQYQKHGISLFAFWGEHEQAFALFEKYQIHPQIWKTAPSPDGDDDAARIAAAVAALTPLAEKTKRQQLPLGLYNHGGWGGEPRNLVAVCLALRQKGFDHVGIVYNFHHGHGHIQDWAESLAIMQRYLLCLNLNGMNASGTPKILGIGKGEHDADMLKVVAESGYRGRIGILNHREQIDAREGLLENLQGLAQVKQQVAETIAEAKQTAIPVGTPYDPALVKRLVQSAAEKGDVQKGATLFSSERLACLQCHKVGDKGGTVGPELSRIGKERELTHVVESVLWPKRDVKPEYVSWNIATVKGGVLTGYKLKSDAGSFELYQPALGKTVRVLLDDVDDEVQVGTLMPDGLVAALSGQERLDLFRFLLELGRTPAADRAVAAMVVPTHGHKPAMFPIELPPLRPEDHLLWQAPVNENRMYDFYAKEANYFRTLNEVPPLLLDYPELNGGSIGKWGTRPDPNWRDFRWNESDHGSLLAGIFRNDGQVVPRGICVHLGDKKQLAICFNPDTLKYEALWKDGFVSLSGVRYGFMDGLTRVGTLLPLPQIEEPVGEKTYQGLYRSGNRVVFAYRVGEVDYLDAPWANERGEFLREVAPVEQHSLRHVLQGGPSQWPQKLTTKIEFGTQPGYAIDTIEVPFENPMGALFFFGGVDFLSDGSALLCTMQGDVWKVTGLSMEPGSQAPVTWKRFASGLNQALGLLVVDDVPYVLGRDMITRLHDLNQDGEADFYECFSKAFATSSAGHDFLCGLQRDKDGNFYISSGNQGLVKISPDGKQAQVIATGLRNPDGLGILPDGRLTVPCSQGNWTPASMVCAVPNTLPPDGQVPHYGYLGPKDGKAPSLPLFYLPRGLDNSSGGQTFVNSDRWGPMQQHLIHYSYGTASAFLILEDEVNGQHQGTIVPLPGDFRSGIHRGRVNPADGQLYVVGMNGWTCFAPDDGNFQRIRYTGTPVQTPVGIHAHQNGVTVEFALPLDPQVAGDLKKQFAQAWNYRYSRAYGSAEFSPSLRGVRGHDHVPITSVHLLPDGKTLFLEMPTLQPVNQLHLQLEVNPQDRRHDLIATIHALDQPFKKFPGDQPVAKTVAPHPIEADMVLLNRQIPNPWGKDIRGARGLTLDTGMNLTFKNPVLKAKAGEAIRFTLRNPDVVPHNWALVRPGKLQSVGEAVNGLITDPDAYLRSYVPQTDDVLVYTDIVDPGESTIISFHAPKEPGRYPYLCTFPGHWTVMNGVLIVE